MRVQAKIVRLLAVLLVVVAAIAFGVSQFHVPVTPRADSAADPSRSEPVANAQQADPVVDLALLRDEQLDVAGDQSDQFEARQFEVQVMAHEAAGDADVRVELLFGEREDMKSVALILDRAGTARWPSSSRAPRPWLVDFAFPTVGAWRQSLTDESLHATLTMPPTCVLDIEVVEQDGRVTSDELTVAIRSPQASWPGNRWRPLAMVGGRAELLAEAAGERIELQILGASGRSTQFVCFAADVAGARLPVSVPLPSVRGVELELHDLPKPETAQHEWLVAVHPLDSAKMSCHRLPGQDRGQRYVFFPPKQSQATRPRNSWFVTAERASDPGEVYWGESNAANAVTMRAFTVLAEGRCVDAKGVGVAGCQVNLTAVGRRAVLHVVVTDKHGKFRIMGPAHASFPLEVVLHGTTGKNRVSASLPHQGIVTLRVDR